MKKIITFFITAFVFWAGVVFCYDSNIIHPRLTVAAVDLYNLEGKKAISDEEKNWISFGARAEDTDPRYVNHFFNPKSGEGLSEGFIKGKSALEWSKKQVTASGDYSVSKVLDNYRINDKKRAFQGIGHILHLIQDMSVPAHVRLDMHPDGDPYESWAAQWGTVSDAGLSKISISNIDQVFYDLANYTYDNFFSKDTVGLFKEIEFVDKEVGEEVHNYGVCEINKDKFYCLRKIITPSLTFYKVDELVINLDYWKMLHPKAVGYSAGVIEWFMNEFEKIDQEKKNQGLIARSLNRVGNFFSNNWNDAVYSVGDRMLATRSLVNNGVSMFREASTFGGYFAESSKEVMVATGEKTVEAGKVAGISALTSAATLSEQAAKGTVGALKTSVDLVKEVKGVAISGINNAEEMINDMREKVLSEFDSSNSIEDISKISEAKAEGVQNKESILSTTSQKQVIKVSRVIDGDTIVLNNGERVRYIGVDAPELRSDGPDDDECLAWFSKIRNEQLIFNKELKLIKDPGMESDKYGRKLYYIYVGNVLVNEILAKEGLAKVFYCQPQWENCPMPLDNVVKNIIIEAGASAKLNKRGVYSDVCAKKEATSKNVSKDNIVAPIDDKFVNYSGEINDNQLLNNESEVAPEKNNPTENASSTNNNPEHEIESGDVASSTNEEVEEEIIETFDFYAYDLNTASEIFIGSTTVGISLSGVSDYDSFYLLLDGENNPTLESEWLSDVPETFLMPYDESNFYGIKVWGRKGEEVFFLGLSEFYLDLRKPSIDLVGVPAYFSSSSDLMIDYEIDDNAREYVEDWELDYSAFVWRYALDNDWQIGSDDRGSLIFNELFDGEHLFEVEATDIVGRLSTSSIVWIVDTEAPVTDLSVDLENDNQFLISWSASDETLASTTVSGIDYFNVQIKTSSSWGNWLEKTQDTSLLYSYINGPVYFRARATDRAGNIGLWSQEKVIDLNNSQNDGKSDHVVISEIMLGSNSSPLDEFVEIYNPTMTTFNLSGWKLSRKTKSGSEYNLLTNFSDSVIWPHGFYLIAHPSGYSGSVAPDEVYSTSQSLADDNTVILYGSDGKTVIDLVGLGNASEYEESPFMNPPKNKSVERKQDIDSTVESMNDDFGDKWEGNGYDSNNNSNDFILKNTPDPQNSESLIEPVFNIRLN